MKIIVLVCFSLALCSCSSNRDVSQNTINNNKEYNITFNGFGRSFYDPEMVDLGFKVETVDANIVRAAEVHKAKQETVKQYLLENADKIITNALRPSQVVREENQGSNPEWKVRYRFVSDYFVRAKVVNDIEDFQVKLIGSGVEAIYLMDFFSEKSEKYREEARNNAIDDSRRKMDSVARKMNWTNVKVKSIGFNDETFVDYNSNNNVSSLRFGARSGGGSRRQSGEGVVKGVQYADAKVSIVYSYEMIE